jgi:hypothetical protein
MSLCYLCLLCGWPHKCWSCPTQLISILAPGGRLVSTFATARKLPSGEWSYWHVHQIAEALVKEFNQYPNISATLLYGPDTRQYNNVAIVIDKN